MIVGFLLPLRKKRTAIEPRRTTIATTTSGMKRTSITEFRSESDIMELDEGDERERGEVFFTGVETK